MRIRDKRLECGFTQDELAAAVGVTQSAVSQWESEVNLPETAKLRSIAKVLNCKVDDLIDTDNSKSETTNPEEVKAK